MTRHADKVVRRGSSIRKGVTIREISIDEVQPWLVPSKSPLTRTSDNGPEIMCPLCESWWNLLQITQLQYVEKYAPQLIVPMKCPAPTCGHVFALHPDPEV